jgi:hypothetical protein
MFLSLPFNGRAGVRMVLSDVSIARTARSYNGLGRQPTMRGAFRQFVAAMGRSYHEPCSPM